MSSVFFSVFPEHQDVDLKNLVLPTTQRYSVYCHWGGKKLKMFTFQKLETENSLLFSLKLYKPINQLLQNTYLWSSNMILLSFHSILANIPVFLNTRDRPIMVLADNQGRYSAFFWLPVSLCIVSNCWLMQYPFTNCIHCLIYRSQQYLIGFKSQVIA